MEVVEMVTDAGKKDFQWFIVVNDPNTNEIVARELARLNVADGNDTTFTDNKGIERNGWRVQFSVLNTFLMAAATDKRLKLKPFVKEGGASPREWTLAKKKRTSAKMREAKKRLKEITTKK